MPLMIGVSSALVVAGCGGGTATEAEPATASPADATSSAATAGGSASAAATDCPVTLTDAWVKAADSGMTGEFGVLSNGGDADVTIVGGSTPAAAMVELHEVSDGTMKQVPGGFEIPAGGSLTLEPGGYHIMLMQLTGPIAPGDEITTTLECSTGGTADLVATAKEFAGGNEEYVGDGMGDGASMGDAMQPSATAESESMG